MQSGDAYMQFNMSWSKYRDIEAILQDHESLLRWSQDEVVLDAGCGPGDVTHNVLLPFLPDAAVKHLVGVDISPSMKEHGYKNFPHPKLIFDTFDLAQDDVIKLTQDPRLQDGFDKIFSFYVLNWIPDLKSALRNIHALLKPGGQSLFWFPANCNYCQRAYIEVQKRQPWSRILQGLEREMSPSFGKDPAGEFEGVLKEVGFKVITCKFVTTDYEFNNLNGWKNLVESMDKHFSKIPADLKEQYLEECVDVMRKDNVLQELDDGKVLVLHKMISAFIEKEDKLNI
nr:PREDICTED: juvenile hormone acid O-methyltransferase-like [Bemisia tabaci]